MSMETKDVTSGVVTTISDSDLVMVAGNGNWSPIKFADLMAAIRGGIQIGGRNLLKGSHNGIGWSKTPEDGVFTIKAPSYYEITVAGPKIPLEVGKTYTVSFMAKATSNVLSIDVWLSANVNGVYFCLPRLTEVWTKYSKQVTVSATATLTSNFRLDNNGSTDGQPATVWIKDIKVEEGNMATAWTPAPEDIASGAWGGVNQRFTISYKLPSDECEKGGAHDTDFGTDRSAEECTDGVLTFRTLDSLCRFIGRATESKPSQSNNLSDWSPLQFSTECDEYRRDVDRRLVSNVRRDARNISKYTSFKLRAFACTAQGWSDSTNILRKKWYSVPTENKIRSLGALEDVDCYLESRKEVANAD